MDVVDAGVDDGDVDAVAADAGLVDPIRPDVLDAPGVLVFEVAGLCAVIEATIVPSRSMDATFGLRRRPASAASGAVAEKPGMIE